MDVLKVSLKKCNSLNDSQAFWMALCIWVHSRGIHTTQCKWWKEHTITQQPTCQQHQAPADTSVEESMALHCCYNQLYKSGVEARDCLQSGNNTDPKFHIRVSSVECQFQRE